MTAGATTSAVLRRDDWLAINRRGTARWLATLRTPAPAADVAAIVERIRREGDAAVRDLTRELDGVQLETLFVPAADLASAVELITPELRRVIEACAGAVRRFHAEQGAPLRQERRVRTWPGVVAWRRWSPVALAGGYIPGGRASYPSSVLMLGVPAQLAGIDELILATPPGLGGSVDPGVLFAASLVGVRRILRVGGAQAIAAMAYGTESVPRVDRILGPGNAWVAAAKRYVASDVSVDLPAGPSECVVVADESAYPEWIAADLLAQAEHGPDSVAILVTDQAALVDEVEQRLVEQAATLATGDRALDALRSWGRCVLVSDLAGALEVVNAVAPEHVSLQCQGAEPLARKVRNAGAVFIGRWAAIAAGDYAIGTNHILPTGGAARAFGGVGVESFGRWIEVQEVTAVGARRLAPIVDAIAIAERLPAHGASVQVRTERSRVDGGSGVADDPLDLLRRPEPVSPYATEPSDEDIVASLDLDPDRLARFDLNILGGGPLPGAADALKRFDPVRAVTYGDMSYRRLRAALGQRHGVAPRRVLPGAGADELIRLVATATLGAGDAALVAPPTFSMFAVETRLAGGRVVEHPRRDPGEPQPVGDLRAIAEAEAARLVWLCNPNNPTGDRYALADIRALAKDLSAIVLVDEVYQEFAEADSGEAADAASALRLQDELPNLVVLRSLSKSFGIAGARVGYLVVPDALADRFDAIRLPLSVSGAAEAMALGALADEDAARARQREMVQERRRMAAAIEALGCRTLPSVTNFVAFRPPDGHALAAALAKSGLIVREFDAGPMAGWLRVNALDHARTTRLIEALGALLA